MDIIKIHSLFRLAAVAAALILGTAEAGAQFYTAGDDPGCRRWYSIESENYKVIYPKGLDSLARVYAREMEKYRRSVGLTSGYVPGDHIRGKMPVVMHAYNSVSNGSVAWAPKRMDAYTLPDMYAPEAHPWVSQLAVHESRHISQMQFGLSNIMRPFNWFFGEMWNGLTAGVYTEQSLLEGDAVIAETELTRSGRGRKADFLNYYMVCFDQGDLRDWNQWRYGSQRKYTPDWYALGYLTCGGMRWMYDRDDYMAEYLDYASRHPIRFDVREVMARRCTGKDLVHSFPAIRDSVTTVWKADAELRRPYTPMQQVTREPGRQADYENLVFAGDGLFAVKHGYYDNYKIVRILLPEEEDDAEKNPAGKDSEEDTGKYTETDTEKYPETAPEGHPLQPDSAGDCAPLNAGEHFLTHTGSYTGALKYSPLTGRLCWSESVPDARWTLKYNSLIRGIRPDGHGQGRLTYRGWLYNPEPSEEYPHIATVETRPEGGTRLTVINGRDGRRELSFNAPDTLQFTELAWVGDDIYVTALSGNGFGVYRLAVGEDHLFNLRGALRSPYSFVYSVPEEEYRWIQVLAPQPVQVKNFQVYVPEGKAVNMEGDGGRHEPDTEGAPVGPGWNSNGDIRLLFTCDRTGVNELYSLSPADGTLKQLTSTRYGASDYRFSPDGKWLYCSSQTIRGKMIFRTPADSLLDRPVDWSRRYSWPIAEKLSKQASERAVKLYGDADILTTDAARADTMTLSKPKRYHKIPQMFRVHSWAPFYADIPTLMNASDLGDNLFDYINLGATAVIQNQLGTFSGIVGYKAAKDPYDKSVWRHSAHINLTYSGLYPVFEFHLDFNDRAAKQSRLIFRQVTENRYSVYTNSEAYPSVPSISGRISAYIPFRFSSGGWSRGFTPRVTYQISNDRRDANAFIFNKINAIKTEPENTETAGMPSDFLVSDWVTKGKMKSLKNLPSQNVSASATLYGTLSVTNSAVFPRWGGGVQGGVSIPAGMTHWYSPVAYGYAYGYFPGFTREQGLKMTALYQTQIPSNENGKIYRNAIFHTGAAGVLPRGFTDAAFSSALIQHTSNVARLTADYAIPIYLGDRAILWSGFYIRRMILTPHFDCTLFSNKEMYAYNGLNLPSSANRTGMLATYGFDLSLDFGCIFWLTFPCTIGISVNFNGAPDWNSLASTGELLGVRSIQKYYIGPVFSFSLL